MMSVTHASIDLGATQQDDNKGNTKIGELSMMKNDVSIRIRELKEKPGKEIILTFKDYELLLDNRCLGKDTEACDKCKLKFRCYSSDAIRISFDEELAKMPLPSKRPTLGEAIQWYLQNKGVDPNLTKIVAYDTIEEDKKGKKRKAK